MLRTRLAILVIAIVIGSSLMAQEIRVAPGETVTAGDLHFEVGETVSRAGVVVHFQPQVAQSGEFEGFLYRGVDKLGAGDEILLHSPKFVPGDGAEGLSIWDAERWVTVRIASVEAGGNTFTIHLTEPLRIRNTSTLDGNERGNAPPLKHSYAKRLMFVRENDSDAYRLISAPHSPKWGGDKPAR
ncbi:MAG TPA: hypothetical protein VM534_04585 [Thermoanaerobaculia bacterium]|nr:hypothetical protein [Thermoanaerobaculia bacterium]